MKIGIAMSDIIENKMKVSWKDILYAGVVGWG